MQTHEHQNTDYAGPECNLPLQVLMRLYAAGNTTVMGSQFFSISPEYSEETRFPIGKLNFTRFGTSIVGMVPNELYCFAFTKRAEDVSSFIETGYEGFFIVDDRMRSVLEQSLIEKSEFYSINVVLRDKSSRSSDDLGGGEILTGRHWLWWHYDMLSIIDWSTTVGDKLLRNPDVRAFPDWNVAGLHAFDRLVLTRVPYAERDVFGLAARSHFAKHRFVSPAFRDRLVAARLLYKEGTVGLIDFGLEPLRKARCADLNHWPGFQIAGTSTITAGAYDPPFTAHPSGARALI